MSSVSDRPIPGGDRLNLAEITSSIVSLYRRHYGKGPTKAKTQMVGDTVICELEDFSTAVEKTLVRQGEHEHVRELRLKFQNALEPDFKAVVEAKTGRKVRAFLSQTLIEPELAIEVFLLEPASARR